MRAFSAARVKKVSCRSRARIQRSATWTATSTFALSRGFAGRAGSTHGVIVLRPLGVGALHARLVPARPRHAAAQLIRHPHRRHAAKELDGADVARNPVGALLRAGRLGEGVIRRAEHGDKQLDGAHLAGGRVDDRRPHPGVVDEGLLAGLVHLAHREALPRPPGAIPRAEGRVAIAGPDARRGTRRAAAPA